MRLQNIYIYINIKEILFYKRLKNKYTTLLLSVLHTHCYIMNYITINKNIVVTC